MTATARPYQPIIVVRVILTRHFDGSCLQSTWTPAFIGQQTTLNLSVLIMDAGGGIRWW